MPGKVAVVGSGVIGRCWAVLFARAKFDVVLYDIQETQVSAGIEGISKQLAEIEEAGLLKGQSIEEVAARVSGTNKLEEALSGAIYVQECIPENVDFKKKIFAEFDALADDTIILASSTSCIKPSVFTEGLAHKAQCIVSHPVNPPHYIPLVEVVPSPWTSQEVIDKTQQIMKELGQSPVLVKKEVNGFIVNRLQYALLMEAWRLVEDGVASPDDVDTAVSQGLGLRWSFMGPFQTIDLNANGVQHYCDLYGGNITAVCKEQEDSREWQGSATAGVIDAAIRAQYPIEGLADRRAWRDTRLRELALHKLKQNEAEAAAASKE